MPHTTNTDIRRLVTAQRNRLGDLVEPSTTPHGTGCRSARDGGYGTWWPTAPSRIWQRRGDSPPS